MDHSSRNLRFDTELSGEELCGETPNKTESCSKPGYARWMCRRGLVRGQHFTWSKWRSSKTWILWTVLLSSITDDQLFIQMEFLQNNAIPRDRSVYVSGSGSHGLESAFLSRYQLKFRSSLQIVVFFWCMRLQRNCRRAGKAPETLFSDRRPSRRWWSAQYAFCWSAEEQLQQSNKAGWMRLSRSSLPWRVGMCSPLLKSTLH